MRFKKPNNFDRKEKTFFAIWPVRTSDETRWLEKVTVIYRYSMWEERWIPYVFLECSNNF